MVPGASLRPTPAAEQLLTVAEVAEHLRCSAWGVYKLIERGQLEAIKVLGKWRIEAPAITRYLDAQRCSTRSRELSDPMPRPRRGGDLLAEARELRKRQLA
jgi:excisionase family DNA binding protein